MAQHESNNGNYEDIARSIREAAQKPPHSGMESVPEELRERPVREFDNTPLHQAAEVHFDPQNPPDDISNLNLLPSEIAAIDQSSAERGNKVLPPVDNEPETPTEAKHTGRNVAIGGTLLALIVGTGAYLGLNNGHDETPEAHGTNHDKNTSQIKDVVEPGLKPLTENSTAMQRHEATVGTITTADFAKLAQPDFINPLKELSTVNDWLASAPGVAPYTPDSLEVQNDALYQDQLTENELFGQPLPFKDTDYAKQKLGDVTFATEQDWQNALATGDATKFFAKAMDQFFTPKWAIAEEIYAHEVAAGNGANPDVINWLHQYVVLDNFKSRDSIQADFDSFQQEQLAAYEANPDAYTEPTPESMPVTRVEEVRIIQGVGGEGSADSPNLSTALIWARFNTADAQTAGDAGEYYQGLYSVAVLPVQSKDKTPQQFHTAVLDFLPTN